MTTRILANLTSKTALVAVAEKIHAVRLGKLSLTLTLLDLSAALHTANHKNLLFVLMSHGLSATAWWSFAFYLVMVTSDDPLCRLSLGVLLYIPGNASPCQNLGKLPDHTIFGEFSCYSMSLLAGSPSSPRC